MKKLLGVFVASAIVSGCATVGNDFNEENVAKIVDGKTTKSEIVEWFGQPNGRQSSSDYAEGYTYTFTDAHASATSYIPIIGMLIGETKSQSKNLFVYFNEDGTVAEHNYFDLDLSSR